MKKLKIFFPLLLCFFTQAVSAQEVAPELEYAFEIRAVCDPAYSVGKTAHGERIVIPIVGGTFEGPNIKGTVLPGGADYQLVDMDSTGSPTGRTELEAIYCIKTDDGVTIHVRNVGILVSSPRGFCPPGNGGTEGGVKTIGGQEGAFYFRTVPKFEAPNDSKYDWLNNAIFICTPEGKDGYISLKMWKVK